MRKSKDFRSWLAPCLRAFTALKHAGGCDYGTQQTMLLEFDRYVHRHVKAPFSSAALMDYLKAKSHLAPRSRDNVVALLWQALAYAKRHGASVMDLPPRPPKPMFCVNRHHPRILTEAEFGVLLSAAARLSPMDSYRPVTTTTILGLLWTTGLRIGEALALDVGDIDFHDRLLTVRAGKFGKDRVLPLKNSTAAALDKYLHHPLRKKSASCSAPLFISMRGRRLCIGSFRGTYKQSWAMAALPGPRPRLHDIRHAFAVHRVAGWYVAGVDVNAKLPALSTYLGHVSVENTRLYLVANGSLLEAASARFARGTAALDGGRP